ncbi:MAG: hypothetical protein IJR61_06195, partial [Clostridia bacterium]|nr:hypothetical protein [Clostridia bacterium]
MRSRQARWRPCGRRPCGKPFRTTRNLYFGLQIRQGEHAPAVSEREENGYFSDIYDFVERMAGNVNRKAFESLLYAGAFDGFGIQRRQFELPGRSGQPFIDEIVRYGELYRNDTVDAAA